MMIFYRLRNWHVSGIQDCPDGEIKGLQRRKRLANIKTVSYQICDGSEWPIVMDQTSPTTRKNILNEYKT